MGMASSMGSARKIAPLMRNSDRNISTKMTTSMDDISTSVKVVELQK